MLLHIMQKFIKFSKKMGPLIQLLLRFIYEVIHKPTKYYVPV